MFGETAVRVRLKGINKVKKKMSDGSTKLYYYHRATGKALNGEPGTPEFVASFAAIEEQLKRQDAHTLNGLIREYTSDNCKEFFILAASTKKEYKRMLTKAEPKFGDLPIAALNDPRVSEDLYGWRDEVAGESGLREADNRMVVLSAMLSWAVLRRKIAVNPLVGYKRLYKVDRSDKIWLPEHIEAFMKVAPVEMQRALILALHTGLRQGDIRALTWTAYDGAKLTVRVSKSRVRGAPPRIVTIPCTKALKRMLDDIKRTNAVVLTTASGRPWKKRYFFEQWTKAVTAAGITDLHFNDLRGTAVTLLAEAGCTIPEIVSITGHTIKSATAILEKYLARTGHLAHQAITKFENAERTNFANRLQTGTIPAKKISAK